MGSSIISTDIYELSGTIDELQKQYMEEESETTRAIGTYGMINDIASSEIQNAVIMASETANEMWPSRAKFEKNVITHAIIQNITDINAVPAEIRVLIGIEDNILESLLVNDKFTIDKECPIYIGKFEYHLPYDLIIERKVIKNNEKVYTARYDMSRKNPISDITNPYLQAPFVQAYSKQKNIVVDCVLQQISLVTHSQKLLTKNPIENKTYEFEFDDQLADFEVKVTENDKVTYLTPIFEGMGIDDSLELFCYYTYANSNTIRVRFDSISYMPTMNAKIETIVKTTKGSEGNFEYNESKIASISSTRFGYKNVSLYIGIGSNSENGEDKKSVEELRKILPKEALSRGSVTNMQDVQNYFNMLNTDTHRMLFQKKVDNQFERTYYAFMVLKDNYNNVIPTNTINLLVDRETDFDTHVNRKYTLKPGCVIVYDKENKIGRIVSREDIENNPITDPNTFVYTVPFTTVVTDDPLYMSYYLTIMNISEPLEFTYINQESPVQFITTQAVWTRGYSVKPNKYQLDFVITQNILTDRGIIEYDKNGKVNVVNARAVVVFYNDGIYDDGTVPYRYAFADLDASKSTTDYQYTMHLELETNDQINDDAKIRIEDMYIPGSTDKDYGYVSGKTKVKIYIICKIDGGVEYGRYDLDDIIPEGLDGWTVSNMYTVENGLDFYINYSDIINSVVVNKGIEDKYDTRNGYLIKSIPVLRRDYATDEYNMLYFISQLNYKKAYIDRAIYLLENNFKVDFKLFNSYGPSTIYSTDKAGENIIDRVNLTMNFEIKLVKASDVYTKDYIIRDIKKIVENLNDMSNLHIPNLITEITNTYRPNSIEYIEFLGFNEYGPGVQHLYRNEYDDVTIVPEFLNINTESDMTPSINIRIAQ